MVIALPVIRISHGWLPRPKAPSCSENSISVARWELRSSRAAAAQVAARFNWLYHDTATYAPYATETAHVPSLLLGRKCAPGALMRFKYSIVCSSFSALLRRLSCACCRSGCCFGIPLTPVAPPMPARCE